MDDIDLYLLGRHLEERVAQSLHATVGVSLDDEVQLLERAEGDAVAYVGQREACLRAQALLALELLALVGNLSCLLLGLHHVERVAGGGRSVESEYYCGFCRAGFLHALVALVEHGLDASVARSGDDDIAHFQRSVAYEHRRHVAAALVERRLDDGAGGAAVRVGFQVEHLSFEQHLFEQLVDAESFFRRYLLALVLAAPFLHEQVHLREVLAYLVGVCSRLVNLVYGEHHRYVGGLCVCDGLLGGRHDAVVSRYDDDGDVGHLGSAGTHGGERLVTRCVEERDLTSVGQCHVVCSDVLGDSSRLAGDHVGVTYVVEQRCLSVVYVTHDGDNRCARHEIVLVVLLLTHGLAYLCAHILGLESELLCHQVDGLGVEALVD